jgi:hypothetical protein
MRLSDQARDADEQVVLDIVDDVFGPLLAAGRARAELTLSDDVAVPSELDLHPANARAAPLYLAFDAPRVLYVSLGRHGTHFELVERSDEVFAAAVREIVAAVVAGRYREHVELQPDGALKAAEGVLEVAGAEPRRISFRAPHVLGPASRHDVSYEPY